MNKLLLIGYGAIGRYVLDAVQSSTHSRVVALLCRPGREEHARQVLGKAITCVDDPARIETPFDLVVECAGGFESTRDNGTHVHYTASGSIS